MTSQPETLDQAETRWSMNRKEKILRTTDSIERASLMAINEACDTVHRVTILLTQGAANDR